ncbi:MAG TPA: UDP-N-acetylmuramate--L-alanine ligase [Oscillospiraceae bacterium]|nr:UDP-N-acetylmuramate--L-alanine ligase [Oscillospiraceae bacterium]HPF55623.1 UDP-N-acetylmuramate--L-alanine ligase [Clostridiales bacterium]HPK34190.1 UDP-N-acetylmuramate--L-alanine ligase [Oscillospiraceae bacterium]HPR74907.1 UDP-N-acetylmuramate--L-alanine ligase [Oscillospiraceae bacterium]
MSEIYRFDALKARKIHFIGIGGSGMYPLAQILHSEGYQITGSDNNPSPTVDAVREMGIPVTMGHSPENIVDCELVVYTAALLEDNPELLAAKAKGIPTMPRAKLLGIVANSYENAVGICGTHGKTTSTSMLTEIFLKAGKDPSAVIGGKLASIGGSGRVGKSEYMTCEADEFRDTFLNIYPAYSLILNVDEDHLEYFKNLENIIKSFAQFANQTKKAVIANGDDANTLKVVKSCKTDVVLFGTSAGCRFQARNISENGPYFSFELYSDGKLTGNIDLKIPGKHNVMNSLGVLAAADQCSVEIKDAIEAVNAFQGAGRRFETIGKFNGFTLIDDYAHNPTELAATISAAKLIGCKRIVAVFQPVTFSRTKLMLDGLADSLNMADQTILLPIMGAREINTYGVSSADLAAKIKNCVLTDGFESAAKAIKENAAPGDLVLTLGCGDVYKVIPYLKDLINA